MFGGFEENKSFTALPGAAYVRPEPKKMRLASRIWVTMNHFDAV